MIQQARRMENIPFSPIRKVFAEVDKMKAEGKKVISLGIGEPDFDTPPHIIDAMTEAGKKGLTHYVNNKGIIEFRQAVCRKLKRDNGLTYDPEEIIGTVGVSEGVYISMVSFLNPGDEILVPDPSWLNYTHVPNMIEAVPVPYALRQETNFQMDVDELERLVTPRTKMIAVLNPSNPTGAVQSYDTLKKVAEFAVKHDLTVISDEIYEKILYDGETHTSLASFPGMWERTILLNGFAKAFAMTGWRLGYVAAPLPLVQVMNRLHMYIVTHSSSMVQYAGAVALDGPQDSVDAMVSEFTRRRNYMLAEMATMPLISCARPGGAFYLFPSIEKTGMSCEDFTTYLLRESGVAVVPGTAFGAAGKGHVRISYATSYENIIEATAGIRRALEKLVK